MAGWTDWVYPGSNLQPQAPDQTNWGYALSSGMKMAPAMALGTVAPGSQFVTQPVVDWLNKKPKSKAAAAPAPEVLDFGQTPSTGATTPAGGGAVGLGADPHSDPTAFFTGLVGKTVKINSAQRDPAHNAAVGGASNSQHLTGNAWDIAVPGMTGAALAEKIRQSGVPYHQLIIEGNGVHFGAAEGHNDGQYMLRHGDAHNASYSLLTPTVGRNDDPYTAAPVATIDPSVAMGYIPTPKMLHHVQLPDAPQEALPAAPTPYEQIDKAALLAPLVAASTVKPIDHKGEAWDRVAAMLAGGATAAAGLGRTPGVGELLLAAGGGAGRGFASKKDEQKAAQDHYDELVRQTNVALAQAGINIDLNNVNTRNTNADRADKGKEAVRITNFNNANEVFQTKLKGVLTNLGIDENNLGAWNSANMARGQVGASAYESGVHEQNQVNATQQTLNLAREQAGASGQALDKTVGSILDGVGIARAPSGKADPIEDNARDTARFVAANNVDGAIGALAKELALTGSWKGIGLGVQNEALINRAMMTDKTGAQASTIIGQILSSDHSAAAQLADKLAATGNHPAAAIIAKMRKKKPSG